jgi:hypothetical protein
MDVERTIRCCWLHVLHPSSTLLISEPDELLWDWLTYGISNGCMDDDVSRGCSFAGSCIYRMSRVCSVCEVLAGA